MTTLTNKAANASEAGILGEGGTGVYGRNIFPGGHGVIGYSDDGRGIWGHSKTGLGVIGNSDNGIGVYGESTSNEGVRGVSHSPVHGGVVGTNDHAAGVGIFGKGGRLAGLFEGDVEVTGDICLQNADCAEDFDISSAGSVEPGTVMVLGDEGALHQSQQAYDKRVAGVISGAGDYKPGIVLDKRQTRDNRQPVALMGKVFCKVDAQFGAIAVGDLLTTSLTPGHAMRADDPLKAFGAVIGKALCSLKEGQGMIPILVTLQ